MMVTDQDEAYGEKIRASQAAWSRGGTAGVARGGRPGERAQSASARALSGALHGAGIHLTLPDDRPARFRTPRDRLRATRKARREQVAEAFPDELPQPRCLPRGMHGDDRPAHRRDDRTALAAHRWLLVSARRHADRCLLADRRGAEGPVAARPGRRALSRPRIAGPDGARTAHA